MQKCHANYKESNYLKHIATKHKLLRLAKVITRQNYKILECARKSRNNLAHRGRQPNREVVITLWEQLPELLESATDYKNIGMREIKIGQEINWNNSHNNNFDEWKELVSLMK